MFLHLKVIKILYWSFHSCGKFVEYVLSHPFACWTYRTHQMTYSWALGQVLKETEITTVLVENWVEVHSSQKAGYPHISASSLQNDKHNVVPLQ